MRCSQTWHQQRLEKAQCVGFSLSGILSAAVGRTCWGWFAGVKDYGNRAVIFVVSVKVKLAPQQSDDPQIDE